MLKLSLKNSNYHNPVLPTIAIDWLAVQPGEKYIDATLGGGSHTAEIIRRGGKVLGLDQDPDAISACLALPKPLDEGGPDLVLVQTNFIYLAEIVAQYQWQPAAGILFDLGVSQHQVEVASRGFSWAKDGPLDMRMGESAVTAANIINQFPVSQLTSLFRNYGEIPVARTLAIKIIAARPLRTTGQLAKITGKWSRQAFQALRIAVNDELGAIATSLPVALEVLQAGGRLVMISFHSLEDRIVKQQFVAWQKAGRGQVLTKKPVLGERGSKLRAFQKQK